MINIAITMLTTSTMIATNSTATAFCHVAREEEEREPVGRREKEGIERWVKRREIDLNLEEIEKINDNFQIKL